MVQAKLVVGGAHDPAEAEADRVAESILRLLAGGASTSPSAPTARIRRAPARAGGSIGAAGGAVDADTEQRIRRSRGNPLDTDTKGKMESAFGADFSAVRVHVGSESDDLNARLGARAFTSRSDIFVRRQDYAPNSGAGQRLLAHELAHTLQNGSTISRALDEAAAPESESEESSELEAEDGEVVFSLAPVSAEGYTMGAGTFQEDAAQARPVSRRTGSGAPRSAAGPVALGWDSSFSTASRISRDDSIVGRAGDYFKLKEAQLKPTTTEVGNASAFGEMTPGYTFTGLEVAYSKKEGRLRVKGSVEGTYNWGTNAGGKIDVPSATDGVVTADNYEQIAADLTPALEEKSWRAPRSTYWSKDICARHEKYHAKDEEKWFLKNGTAIIDKYLKANPVTISDEDREDLTKVKALGQTAMEGAIKHLDKESWRFYAGADGTSYCSRPGEIRAFGDGKAPYQKLAAGVKAHGKKLAKAKKKPAT